MTFCLIVFVRVGLWTFWNDIQGFSVLVIVSSRVLFVCGKHIFYSPWTTTAVFHALSYCRMTKIRKKVNFLEYRIKSWAKKPRIECTNLTHEISQSVFTLFLHLYILRKTSQLLLLLKLIYLNLIHCAWKRTPCYDEFTCKSLQLDGSAKVYLLVTR